MFEYEKTILDSRRDEDTRETYECSFDNGYD